MAQLKNLFVCYIPGLDVRNVSPETTPYIHDLLKSFPSVNISTLPSTELLPSILSGVYPHQNEIWQVRLKKDDEKAFRTRVADGLPDIVSTTVQCLRQRFDQAFDLAAIPSWRRRRFQQFRFKYTRRSKYPDLLNQFGDYPSIFGLLGAKSSYRFTKQFDSLSSLASKLPSPGLKLEFLEMYAFDLTQHWNLDRPDVMQKAYTNTDQFVKQLHHNCRRRDVTLLVLVDHGQEPVRGTIPLISGLHQSGISPSDYTYFVELASSRFWFHTDEARERLTKHLRDLQHCTLLHFKEMHPYHICFEDSGYGEYYLMADPGYIFFPHDFYHPLANFYLGISDRLQRSRTFNPIHRGNHGYLPHHPSEKGYVILLDYNFTPAQPEMELIDFAPTVMALIGEGPAEHMRGKIIFRS